MWDTGDAVVYSYTLNLRESANPSLGPGIEMKRMRADFIVCSGEHPGTMWCPYVVGGDGFRLGSRGTSEISAQSGETSWRRVRACRLRKWLCAREGGGTIARWAGVGGTFSKMIQWSGLPICKLTVEGRKAVQC